MAQGRRTRLGPALGRGGERRRTGRSGRTPRLGDAGGGHRLGQRRGPAVGRLGPRPGPVAAAARPGWERPRRCLRADPRVGGRAATGRGGVPSPRPCAESGRRAHGRAPHPADRAPAAVRPAAGLSGRSRPGPCGHRAACPSHGHERTAPRHRRRARRSPSPVRGTGRRSRPRPGRTRTVRAAPHAADLRGTRPPCRVRAARGAAGPRAHGRSRAGRAVQARRSRRRGVPRARGPHGARRDGPGPARPAAAPRARGVPRPRPARPPRPVAVRRRGGRARGHERAGGLGDARRATTRRGLPRPCRDRPVVPGETSAAGRRGGRTRAVRRPRRAHDRAPRPRHLARAVPRHPGRSSDEGGQPGLRAGVHGVPGRTRLAGPPLTYVCAVLGRAPAPGVGGRHPGRLSAGRLGAAPALSRPAACGRRGPARSPRGRRPG